LFLDLFQDFVCSSDAEAAAFPIASDPRAFLDLFQHCVCSSDAEAVVFPIASDPRACASTASEIILHNFMS